MASKNLVLTAKHWTKTCWPRFRAEWNSSEQCATWELHSSFSLRNNPEERSSQLLRCRRLQSHCTICCHM